jgi:hypothetical protein
LNPSSKWPLRSIWPDGSGRYRIGKNPPIKHFHQDAAAAQSWLVVDKWIMRVEMIAEELDP